MLPAWRIIQAHVYSVYVVVAWTLTHSQCPASHIGWETGFVTSEGKEWDTNTGRTKTFCCCLLSVTCKTSCMLWAFPCCLAYWCLLKMEKHLRNLRKMQTRTRRKTKSRTGIFLSFWAFPYASNDMPALIYSCQDLTLYSWYVTVLFFYRQIEICFLSESS